MTYYYVLWIPQTEKRIPAIIKNQLPKEKFRDISELPPFVLEGTIDNATYRVRLTCSLEKNDQHILQLNCLQKSEEGFLVYKLEMSDDEKTLVLDSLTKGMMKAMYHYVKGFFHEHQYHLPSDDSLLNAYYSADEIDLSNQGHKFAVISNYLHSYELKYSGYVNEGNDTIRQVVNQIDNRKVLSKNVKLLRATILNNTKILEGESRYCEFLLNSCSDVVPQALNKRLELLREELMSINRRIVGIDSYLSSEVSIKKAETSIICGFIGVALTVIIFGIQSYFDNGKEIQNEVRQLRKDHHTTKEQLRLQLQSVESRQDSLSHQIEEMGHKVDQVRKRVDKVKSKK